ncbi:MAG: hypothetical protein ACI398_07785 [Clostridium sp.]
MGKSQNIIKKSMSFLEEKKINKSNKVLMIERVLSYSHTLKNGIKKYKVQNNRFTVFILFSVILIDFPIISLPCCLLSVIFLVKMLQLIKYRSIWAIINKIGRDIAYKGIYNKGVIEEMVEEFKFKFGEDIIEYYELIYMIENYELFISKIEKVIKGINEKNNDITEENEYEKETFSSTKYEEINEINFRNKSEWRIYPKNSLLCRNEEGEIKKVNRAIEFFEDKNETADAVVLRGKNKNLTVYLYRKANELQNNVL